MTIEKYQFDEIKEYVEGRQIHMLCAFLTKHETDWPHYQELLHATFKLLVPLSNKNKEFSLETAERLIRLGMDIDNTDASSENLLSVTIRCEAYEMFDLLVKEGINLHSQDFEGKTPLYCAVILSRKPDFVEKLIEAGVDIQQELPDDLKGKNANNVYELAHQINNIDFHAYNGDKRRIITLLDEAEQMQETIRQKKEAAAKQKQTMKQRTGNKGITLKRRM